MPTLIVDTMKCKSGGVVLVLNFRARIAQVEIAVSLLKIFP
jgi:hypothetical protein